MQAAFEPTDQQKDEAALWHTRRAGGSLSAAQEDEFENWLNSDRNNRLAFDQMRVLWAQIEDPARRLSTNRPKMSLSRFRSWFPPHRSFAAMAGMAAIVGGIFFLQPDIIGNIQADIVTDHTTVTPIELPDGSVVQLAANSALATDFANGHRDVELLRGQAFFDVVHRNGDPFRVHTGDATIRVVGTRFNVDYLSHQTIVVVEDGAVRVSSNRDADGVLLGPGQQVAVRGDALAPLEIEDVNLALTWMKGRLSVRNMRVADLMTRLENYSDGKIVVVGKIAGRSISGSFPTTDIAGSLETVADAIGASVVKTSPWLTIIY
ncbi:FecR family protein [Thalassospira alkalitolerans]|uniref:FecR family protein n=1 Tax=Thalassospira alkalitolerans TaxID=1293890 RepID=UPI003AA86684